MNAFDIYTYEFSFGSHPAVIVSHPARVQHKPVVDVLKCSSQRATRAAYAEEVILDQADGLEWPTLCACDLIFAVPKSELKARRGAVSPPRRLEIIRKIIQAMGWV